MVDVHCGGCGQSFPVPPSMVGGVANCPGCGRATPVEGLRDPLWRLMQAVFLIVLIGGGLVAWKLGGPGAAAVTVVAGLVLGWLISRAM